MRGVCNQRNDDKKSKNDYKWSGTMNSNDKRLQTIKNNDKQFLKIKIDNKIHFKIIL